MSGANAISAKPKFKGEESIFAISGGGFLKKDGLNDLKTRLLGKTALAKGVFDRSTCSAQRPRFSTSSGT